MSGTGDSARTANQARAESPSVWTPGRLTEAEFKAFSALIYEKCGINLAPVKLVMLSSRLARRLRALGLATYGEYLDHVRNSARGADELVHLIDVVTTNKTEFFREEKHYGILTERVLPDLVKARHAQLIRVWSAGCSTGEEPYTLAMVLDNWCQKFGGTYALMASDISTRVLETARRGLYPEKAVEGVSDAFKRRYLLRGKDRMAGNVRIVPELRERIDFCRVNLVAEEGFGIAQKYDIIFCRNVVIYFDRETQKRLFERFYRQLVPGGYLFIGLSETLHRINEDFVPLSGSVYRKPSGEME